MEFFILPNCLSICYEKCKKVIPFGPLKDAFSIKNGPQVPFFLGGFVLEALGNKFFQ